MQRTIEGSGLVTDISRLDHKNSKWQVAERHSNLQERVLPSLEKAN